MAVWGGRRAWSAMVVAACLWAVAGCGERTLGPERGSASAPVATPGAGAARTADPAMPAVTELTEFTALVDGAALLLPGGRRIDLSGMRGPAADAVQTRDGWLVTGEGPSLWLVRKDGSLRRLVKATDGRVAVAPDGRRLAWRAGDTLHTGRLTSAGKVVIDRSTPAPERGAPVFHTGDAVVLGYSETGGGWDRRDVWVPARGPYTPSWNANEAVRGALFGIAPDGRSIVGQVGREYGTKDTCLALLDPTARLATVRTACLPVSLANDGAELSPSRRWLAAGVLTDDGRHRTAVIDLRKVFDRPVVAVTWDAEPIGSWLDDRTYLAVQYPAPVRLTRFTVGKAAGVPVTLRGVTEVGAPTLVRRLS